MDDTDYLPPVNSAIENDEIALPYLMRCLQRSETALWEAVMELERNRYFIEGLGLRNTEVFHVIDAACVSIRRACRKTTDLKCAIGKRGIVADRERRKNREERQSIKHLRESIVSEETKDWGASQYFERWLNGEF